MLKTKRICIPLGIECNFKCRYCYRKLLQRGFPLKLSALMKTYLQTVDSSWCEAVVMNGGEPLMYWEKIKEIFSLVKPDVHKKIMTNGSLLTQGIVNYINGNKIELMLSHDGEATKLHRGRDVLDETAILDLLRQIKILSVQTVCTKNNPDVMENFRYISEKLGRTNFFYLPTCVVDNGECQDLIDGFDYDTFDKTLLEFRYYKYQPMPYKTMDGKRKAYLFNVDLDGNVVAWASNKIVGTVENTYEECIDNYNKIFTDKYCDRIKCKLRGDCKAPDEVTDEHSCRCSRIIEGAI